MGGEREQEERLYTLARLGYEAYVETCGRYRERPPRSWDQLTVARRQGWYAATVVIVGVVTRAREIDDALTG